MSDTPPLRTEQIRCPECDLVQTATVEETTLFNIYQHACIGCGYEICESEWDTAWNAAIPHDPRDPYHIFQCWLDKHAALHPDDPRLASDIVDLGLIREYAAQREAEGRLNLWGGMEAMS